MNNTTVAVRWSSRTASPARWPSPLALAASVIVGGTVASVALASSGEHDPHDCFIVHAVPGCSDLACAIMTCADDPSCCESTWDAICVAYANQQCTSRLGDLDGDDSVGPSDLGRMLSFWGLPEGDVTGDFVCSGLDIAVLLANWTE